MLFRMQLYNNLHTACVPERLRMRFLKQPTNFKMNLLVHLLAAISAYLPLLLKVVIGQAPNIADIILFYPQLF